jgi:hypothetical protein
MAALVALEMQSVEVWEMQTFKKSLDRWMPDEITPWLNHAKAPSIPPDEYPLPGSDWVWASNWRYEVKQNQTDREGWEYA